MAPLLPAEGTDTMASESSPLQGYTKARHAIGDVLQELQANLSRELADPREAERCRSLLAKLAEDRVKNLLAADYPPP